MVADSYPRRTTPASPAAMRRAVSAARSACSMTRLASLMNDSPAGVSLTERVVRSRSLNPSSPSSLRTWYPSGCSAMCSFSAAFPKAYVRPLWMRDVP